MTAKLDDVLGPEFARITRARKALEEACAGVVQMAQGVQDFAPMGTDELPAAVAALQSSEYVDEDDAGACWVSRAFTATPTDLIATGEAGLAFGGAVLMLRGALLDLDEAIAAAARSGPTSPGGTFSR
ncbi:hypothetical protein OH782_42330 (plasmid) [Streptomyces sp. NBC_01544]|uniref:hypothetical protein n=1 Tax=Streptomyces sp. NBC_01544 TaxID=2975871 RepID=UPI002F90B04A